MRFAAMFVSGATSYVFLISWAWRWLVKSWEGRP